MSMFSAPATNISQAALQDLKNRSAYVEKIENSELEDSLKKIAELIRANKEKIISEYKAQNSFRSLIRTTGPVDTNFCSMLGPNWLLTYTSESNAKDIISINEYKNKYFIISLNTTIDDSGYNAKGFVAFDNGKNGFDKKDSIALINEYIPRKNIDEIIKELQEWGIKKNIHNELLNNTLFTEGLFSSVSEEKPTQPTNFNYKEANKRYENSLKTILKASKHKLKSISHYKY